MKDYNMKQKILNDKGITIISLIITVVVMIIIVGISINIGLEPLENTRLRGFYTQLEIIQKRIDDIAVTNESYVDTYGNIVYIKEQGTAFEDLNSIQKSDLEAIIENEGDGLHLSASDFRYFTVEQLENILDLSDMEYNVFVDFNTRAVIAEEGININGEKIHILKSNMYFSEYNNEGTINSLSYTAPTEYGRDRYKTTITPNNSEGYDGGKGYIKYKKTSTKYWETLNDTEVVLEYNVEYNIEYIDSNNKSIQETIKVELNSDNIPIISKIIEE